MEERVSRTEGAYDHLATNADLAELKADLNKTLIQMTIGLAGLQLIGLGAVAAILRFLGAN